MDNIQSKERALKAAVEKEQTRLEDRLKALEEKKKELDSMLQTNPKNAFQDIIHLNVGGKGYEIAIKTLQNRKSLLLSKMFSGTVALSQDKDGSYFIDRDAEIFGLLLDYIEDKKTFSPKVLSPMQIELLEQEAEFFQAKELVKMLKDQRSYKEFEIPKPFPEKWSGEPTNDLFVFPYNIGNSSKTVTRNKDISSVTIVKGETTFSPSKFPQFAIKLSVDQIGLKEKGEGFGFCCKNSKCYEKCSMIGFGAFFINTTGEIFIDGEEIDKVPYNQKDSIVLGVNIPSKIVVLQYKNNEKSFWWDNCDKDISFAACFRTDLRITLE